MPAIAAAVPRALLTGHPGQPAPGPGLAPSPNDKLAAGDRVVESSDGFGESVRTFPISQVQKWCS
jgi:hypothetical protein